MVGLDAAHIGHAFAPCDVIVEAGRLVLFAQATGQAWPLFTLADAARVSGYPGVPVPPTFLFCLEMDTPAPQALRALLRIPQQRVLHGEQSFVYHQLAYAGDTLRFETRIADIYAKNEGALQFVRRDTRVTHADRGAVADLSSVTVIRHG